MKKLEYTATHEQAAELEGLAYWIAEQACALERYPDDTDTLEQADITIRFAFDQLDKMRVPFLVQNTVIGWAREWRNWKREDIKSAMARKNIVFQ